MKHVSVFFLLIFTGLIFAQDPAPKKVIHFKELQKFLPAKAPEGFTREKPKGQTVTASGVSSSSASVEFTAQKTERQLQTMDDGSQDSVDTEVTWSARVEITDFAGMGDAVVASMQMMAGMEYDNETEFGYERSVTVAGYKGMEKSNEQEYSRSCELQLAVGTRFIVNSVGSGFANAAILRGLLESMDLKKLEQAK
jgi:hypothetical protein